MSNTAVDLEALVQAALLAIDEPPGEASPPETTMRERFMELMVLILGNLYNKTPVAAALFDRGTMLRVTAGMDDVEAGKLTLRTEDFLRLESLLRQQDGAKAYSMTSATLSVLSTFTTAGPLGDVLDRVLRRYQQDMPSLALRKAARMLGSYYISRVAGI
jgi:hypothetical protein